MPHLTVEYSANLTGFPVATVLKELNDSLCASGEVKEEADLKSRAVAHHDVLIGTAGGERGFVFVTLRLLAGRTADAKAALGERIAAVLRQHTPRPAGMMVQLSVEMVDMDRASYVKERLPGAH